jgi:PAS domain S-box-containing protein
MDASFELLGALFDEAPDAMLLLEDGRIVLANVQATRLYGYSVDELVGMPAEDLSGGEFDADVRRQGRIATDPRTRPLGTGLQLTSKRRDGSTFTADISLSVVTEPSGRSLVLTAVRDASDRIESENSARARALAEQRERGHRLESLGQLAGGIAHDFNNLLGVIMNYTTLLARDVTEPRSAGDLGEIRAAAERAASLTRQLLTFARRDVVDPEPLDINTVVQDAAGMLARTLGGHIRVDLVLDPRPVVAVFDRHQLEQIILNLAINARDAMSDGGVLTISTSAEVTSDGSTEAVLAVGDDGVGMPPAVVERAFEPFFSTKPKGEGTGLGLSTVYGVVQQSGGEVLIASAPGQGTTVTVVMPGSSRDVRLAPGAAPASAQGTEHILLVEDEPALREGTARLLVARGYAVTTACDGVEALAIMDREERPMDLVVTDVAMPRMRGDELAQHLAVRAPEVPILFVSGYDSGVSALDGRLLPKPVIEQDLLEAIREELDG